MPTSKDQWVAWSGGAGIGGQLYRPSLRANRITIVDNRIIGAVRTEVAKMTKNSPVFTVTPQTGDEMDLNASQLGQQLMLHLFTHLKIRELATKGLYWSRITGAGFLKVYWDSTIGESVDVLLGPDNKGLLDAQGAPVKPSALAPIPGVQKKTLHQGDVKVEVRSPFQIFPDPLADSWSEVEWVIEESVKSQGYVQRRYGVTVQPDTPANPGLIEARMGAVFMPGTGGYKGVKVREYWCKPCPEHPKGCRTVWCQKQVLEEDDEPFDAMPYVMLSGIAIPGRLWPTSVATLLRGPQTELNKVKSQIAENRNRIGNPTILASKQAVQDPEKFAASTSTPGGIYFFDDVGSPNAGPSYLAAPPLPAYVTQNIQDILESIQDISAQHDVTSTQIPPGVTAASAINLLMEADDTRLGPALHDYEEQLGALGQKILKIVATFYTDARTIKIGGDNGAWEFTDFKGAMLRDNTHVKVQAGSAFPQSKAAKQAAMQDLLTFFVQSGNPPHGRQLAQFLQDWEVGGAERLIEEFSIDETQCNRENLQLSQGIALGINLYDDDQAHIDNHEEFQKQARYQTFPPNIKQVFEQHVQLHRQRLAQIQQQQMQLANPQAAVQAQQATPPSGPDPQDAAAAQLHLQGAQQQMDFHGQGQQQDAQQAQALAQLAAQFQSQQTQKQQADQQQRQAEEKHQQGLRHAEEAHQAQLAQIAAQARQQAPGASRSRQQPNNPNRKEPSAQH